MVDTIGTRARQLDARSGALNDTRKEQSRNTFDKGGFNVQGVDIAFATTDTITSVANAFPTGLAAGQMIEITGSVLNSRQWRVATVAAGTITVTPAQIQLEAAGPLIDIRTV